MSNQWIVVSDAARARLFSRDADHHLTLVETLTHEESRAHEGDLRTGGKGEVQDSGGAGRHQTDPQTSTSEKHADIFAKQVCERLKAGLNDNEYTSLVVVADPSFLGLLRDQLDKPLERAIHKTIDKNWAQHDQQQIEKQLRTAINPS
ncbi:host attachment protein [Salinisphaera aquimarina]|uniref:Host attachment protein n=1 Tax=Salinisphaera aquimarina TaxID=2094031 RepID=A0ABV7EW22_9GAMM